MDTKSIFQNYRKSCENLNNEIAISNCLKRLNFLFSLSSNFDKEFFQNFTDSLLDSITNIIETSYSEILEFEHYETDTEKNNNDM